MLTSEENEQLTHIGPGTLMGNLLRRYWMPACLSVELPEPETTVRVRLLGEDLVAFRNTDGAIGLLGEHCPHRGASIYYGRNEESGLRCVYHGWKFDISGQCVDMPSEKRSFADQIQATAYPTHESGGIIWTYMGPKDSMTPFRDFGSDSLPEENVRATKFLNTCNWVQSIDGDLDTAHASFLHQMVSIDDIPVDDTDRPGYPSDETSIRAKFLDGAPVVEVADDWFGFRYAGLRQTPNGHTHVRMTAYTLPSTTMIATIPFTTRSIVVVPIDDDNTWRYTYVPQIPAKNENQHVLTIGGRLAQARGEVPPPRRPFSGVLERVDTMENEYHLDRDVQRKVSYSGLPQMAQDRMVTETMGPIYDRTKENLGTTDLAVIRMHSMLLDAALDLADGKTPPALSGPDHDFRSIRSAEKILEPGEDWRVLGTNDDPAVQEALLDRA